MAGYSRWPAVLRKFGVRWYHTLKSPDKGGTPGLFDAHRTATTDGLTVAYVDDFDHYYYAWFPLYLTFWEVYVRLSPGERSFHEVIRSGQRQKPRWDIDMPLRPGMKAGLDQEVVDALLNALEDVLADKGVGFDPAWDIGHFSAHSAAKRSHHLIYVGSACPDNEECGALDRLVRERIPEDLRQYLDPDVTKSTQNFRLYLSGKPGPDGIVVRHKRWESAWLWNGKEVTSRIGEDEVSRFEAGLLSICNGMDTLPPFRAIQAQRSDHTIDEATAAAAIALFTKSDMAGAFQPGEISNHYIHLERIHRSQCPICGRPHDKENASLYVSLEAKGYGVYYNCFRRDRERKEQKMIRLGSLGREEEKVEKVEVKTEAGGLVGFGTKRGLAKAMPAMMASPVPGGLAVVHPISNQVEQALAAAVAKMTTAVRIPAYRGA